MSIIKTIEGKYGVWELIKAPNKKYYAKFFLTHKDSCQYFGKMVYIENIESPDDLEPIIDLLKKSL